MAPALERQRMSRERARLTPPSPIAVRTALGRQRRVHAPVLGIVCIPVLVFFVLFAVKTLPTGES